MTTSRSVVQDVHTGGRPARARDADFILPVAAKFGKLLPAGKGLEFQVCALGISKPLYTPF